MRYPPLGVLLLAIGLTGATSGSAGTSKAPPRHNIHVTYTRMAIEGDVVVCRIRFFKHDLLKAMRAHYDDPDLELGVNAHADSLYARFLDTELVITTPDTTLRSRVISSGEEEEEKLWWYTVQYDATRPVDKLRVKNVLLFEMFTDQKNIFKVQQFPSEVSKSYYFAHGSDSYDISF